MSIQPVGPGAAQQFSPPARPSTSVDGTRQADAATPSGDTQAVKAANQAENTQLTPDQLAQAVTQIQDVIKQTAQSLQFSIDKDTGSTVVKVVDTESKKVLRQIPSEEVLAIAKALDKLQGLLVRQKV
ncbi:flagellar protein FlaG [Zoogloea sp. LCSB751]|uniref:flagellar protein FlaG n=1 Tax=Zoogloea sp. LCSB751 TaxID=1965277 RepID=UPI0009A4E669|nr:flagellar protein FlaG [Zoogloea sp. LCSB751]